MHFTKTIMAAAALSLMAAGDAQAIETLVKGAPASITPLKTPPADTQAGIAADPYTVRDVRVDQTGANPVKARELALKIVPKLAFQKLVAQNLTADEAAAFKYPDDKVIAGLVQDFEVKGEQSSSTRYVANYTVRFSPNVKNYVAIKPMAPITGTAVTATRTTTVGNPARNKDNSQTVIETTVTASDSGVTMSPAVAAAADDDAAATPPPEPAKAVAPSGRLLVLPYYENMSGRTLLWEDENSWRQLWQTAAPRMAGNVELVVPSGDLNDVSSGDTDDVWSGNYRAIEKLAAHYGVTDIVLPVANKSGPYLTVDMYFFRNGTLAGRDVLQPYVSDQTEAEALRTGLQTVIDALQKKGNNAAKADTVANISTALAGKASAGTPVMTTTTSTETVMTGAHAAESAADVDVAMSFGAFADWTAFQRRLAAMTPPVVMDIQSISRDSAKFRLRYSGGIGALQAALQKSGILLEAPAVVVDNAQIGAAPSRPVYSVQLLAQ